MEYNSLYKALQFFGFGEIIVKWLKVLFKDFRLCVCNNGHSSDYLIPSRGLFQGNPISPSGFILIVELLAIMLRGNAEVKGIKI